MTLKFRFFNKLFSLLFIFTILLSCFLINSSALDDNSDSNLSSFSNTDYPFYDSVFLSSFFISSPNLFYKYSYNNANDPFLIFSLNGFVGLEKSFPAGSLAGKYIVLISTISNDINISGGITYSSGAFPTYSFTRLNREPFDFRSLQFHGLSLSDDETLTRLCIRLGDSSNSKPISYSLFGLAVFNSENEAKSYIYSFPPSSDLYGQNYLDFYNEAFDSGYNYARKMLGMGSFDGSSVTIKFLDSLGSVTYSNVFNASFFYDSSTQRFSFHNWYQSNKSTLPKPYKVEITFDLLNLGEDVHFFTDSIFPSVSTMNQSVNYMFFGQPSDVVYASAEYILNTSGGYGLRPDIANASYKYTKFQIFDESLSDTSSQEPQVFDQYYFLTAASVNSESYQLGYKAGYAQGKGDQIREYDGILTSKLNEKYLEGFNAGFARGKIEGQQVSEENWSFAKLIYSVIDAPLLFLKSILGFEILGVNLLGIVGALLTITIIIIVFKKFS